MRGVIRGDKYFIDGKEVPKRTFYKHFPPQPLTGGVPFGHSSTCWPQVSEALAVHSSQVDKANARARKHGVGVHYDKDGRAHIESRAERKKLLRLEGMRDNEAGYGD